MSHQDYKENWVKEKQTEKVQKENEKEVEIIKSCKIIKKSRQSVDQFCNRMYDDAKRRQFLNNQKKEIYENEQNEININNCSFVPNNSREVLHDKNIIVNKGQNKKKLTNYKFHVT